MKEIRQWDMKSMVRKEWERSGQRAATQMDGESGKGSYAGCTRRGRRNNASVRDG